MPRLKSPKSNFFVVVFKSSNKPANQLLPLLLPLLLLVVKARRRRRIRIRKGVQVLLPPLHLPVRSLTLLLLSLRLSLLNNKLSLTALPRRTKAGLPSLVRARRISLLLLLLMRHHHHHHHPRRMARLRLRKRRRILSVPPTLS